jgi:hypothetical protein
MEYFIFHTYTYTIAFTKTCYVRHSVRFTTRYTNLTWNETEVESLGVCIGRPLQLVCPFQVIMYGKSCPHTEGRRRVLSCTWSGVRVCFVSSATITRTVAELKAHVEFLTSLWISCGGQLLNLIWCAAGSWIGFRIEGEKTEDEREEINK